MQEKMAGKQSHKCDCGKVLGSEAEYQEHKKNCHMGKESHGKSGAHVTSR